MADHPHPDLGTVAVCCAVLTISDTRTLKTDHSGQLIQELLLAAGHRLGAYEILADEPRQLQMQIQSLTAIPDLEVIICHGGTGIAPRDTTYEALCGLVEKELPGFGELFRALSYQEIGSRAIASRAMAGVYRGRLVFALPGSGPAVQLGMEKLILPELRHLTRLLQTPK